MRKLPASERLKKTKPYLAKRRFGLPFIGDRNDSRKFNPTVEKIKQAIDFYGFKVRDKKIVEIPDTDLGTGNPVKFKPFPMSIKEMKKSLSNNPFLYRYPYTEGADDIRKELLDYAEQELGIINTEPYSFEDIDEKGLCVHNITYSVSSSILFNTIISIISRPGDVVLVTAPNYGLFTVRAERAGANVHVLNLEKEDDFLINPSKLAKKIDEINESLKNVYNEQLGYTPCVTAFLNENPHNPTGRVMGKKQFTLLKEIAKVCADRGVYIIDDIVYRDITYDKDNLALPIASIPGMFNNTITLLSLSKSYSMAALRAGFVIADEIVIRDVINKTFQEMDSAPDIVGRALAGAFNARNERAKIYNKYFKQLRNIYIYRCMLLKALVSGIDSVPKKYKAKIYKNVSKVLTEINMNLSDLPFDAKVSINETEINMALAGLPFVDFPEQLPTPEAGFFAILDFTGLKGMKYKGRPIRSEYDLLKFFYETYRIRFLVGQSISWPYENELVGRISYSIEEEKLITALLNMNKAIRTLDYKDDYEIRKNQFKDQRQMSKIKVNSMKNAYDSIISSNYLKTLDENELGARYEASFDDYKDLCFVAVRKEEVLGFTCFNPNPNIEFFDSELISLYVKEDEMCKGIETDLFLETCKNLHFLGKKNMVIWCFKEDTKSISYFENLGGKIVTTKTVSLGNACYEKCGIYFHLEN